jgi:hypothetical protein
MRLPERRAAQQATSLAARGSDLELTGEGSIEKLAG